MEISASTLKRSWLLVTIVALAASSAGAQRGSTPPGVVQQVRTALGHGEVAAARAAAEGATDAAARGLGTALVEIFEGKDAEARARLLPLATAAPLGEAALELGLLEIRTGPKEQGLRRLDALAAVRTFASPDDYFRLARAARAVREYLLANDAYQRIAEVPRAEIHAERGDFSFQRHLAGDAMGDYTKALEIDAKWVPAHLGVARALAEENPPAARKALDAARAIAPEHPGVLLLDTQFLLEADDLAAAKVALDRFAKVKPGSLDELYVRAAFAYTESGLAAVEPIAAQIRERNPSTGLGYRTAAEQAVRDYRFDDAAALAAKAAAIEVDDPIAHFVQGLSLARVGDEAGARRALETSREFDRSASSTSNQGGSQVTNNLLKLLDHLETFERVRHNDFIFKFAPEESAVLKAYALPLADEAYKTFSTRYGFKPQGPILIEVFPIHDDFAVRTLGLPGLVGALGACFGRVVTMDSPSARDEGEFSWQATLWHELAHVFSLQLSQYKVPRWLTEGISNYEEHRRQPAWGRELALEFANQLSKGKTFGVKKLPDAFKEPQSLSLAYFEASLVVEHLVEQNGEGGLRTLLLAYANGATDLDAFSKAFGKSVDEVEATFKSFVEQRYGALRNAMADPPKPVEPGDLAGLKARAAAAPGNFVSQLALGQALEKAGDLDAARPVLERAATLAPAASGNASPRAILARIAESQGDVTRARREWRELLASDHTNIVGARRLATLAAAAKATDDEDFALRLVADLDPFDKDVHGQLGRRLFSKGDTAAALIEFEAALAVGPANLAVAHTDAAEALLKLGRRDDAKREALLALQQAPTFARAQDLLLSAIGKE